VEPVYRQFYLNGYGVVDLPPRPVYITLLWQQPVLTNIRQHRAPQGRQLKPMDVTRNQDLVELWGDMLATT
jgi:hypothetical protein